VSLFRKGWLGMAILCASSICISPAKGIDAKPAPGNVFRKIKNDVRQPLLFSVTGFGEAVQKTSLMMGGVANPGGIFHTPIYIHRNTGFIIGKALGVPEILATYRCYDAFFPQQIVVGKNVLREDSKPLVIHSYLPRIHRSAPPFLVCNQVAVHRGFDRSPIEPTHIEGWRLPNVGYFEGGLHHCYRPVVWDRLIFRRPDHGQWADLIDLHLKPWTLVVLHGSQLSLGRIGLPLGLIGGSYRLEKTSQGRPASDDRQEQREDFYSVLSPPMCLLGGVVLMICGGFVMLIWLNSDRPGAIAMTLIGWAGAALGAFLCFSAFVPPF